MLPGVMRLPILLLLSFAILFYYLGLSFFAGLLICGIAFWVNLVVGRISARYFKRFMKW